MDAICQSVPLWQVVESRLSMAGAEMAFLPGKKRRMTPALADDDDSFQVSLEDPVRWISMES